MIITRSFFEGTPYAVAQKLLGVKLVTCCNGIVRAGIIVETEAYAAYDDPASHAYRGKTQRNAPMFGTVGHAYVYFIYGNHYCCNVVAHASQDAAGAVLIRALQPIVGIESMVQARNNIEGYCISNGPGKLTQAMGITGKHQGIDMTLGDILWLEYDHEQQNLAIIATPRIGIRQATERPWRFYIKHNPWVSKHHNT